MLVFGILNVMYQTTSLVPAFRSAGVAAQALGMQGDTARDGRQTLTYGFLQECGNRKAQSLPLGKDCVKYLTKTPKAPLDIDDWMEDNNEAAPNSTSARLRRRDIGLPASYVDNDVEASAAESPTNFRLWLYIDLICVIVVVVCMGKSKESRLHMQLIFQETKLFIWHKMDKGCRRLRRLSDILQSPSDKTAESIRIIGFILYTLLFIFMFGRWIKQQWRWKVASEFITQCKSRIENNELLGEDCTKYTGKKLKPQPEFEMNWWELSSFIFALLFILVKLFTNTRIALDVLRLTLETLGLRRQRNPRDLGRWPI
ncbi:hypothetical protein BKA65DRAFT_547698 [Rhexocercosporidium sp. MPI-PUGE-AT-0058]|nr:hypothetical protein BKA65DRAFT_547698 [Rhexocercosporidium sp. MPI-PUGE-AT-0058]